MKTTYTMAMALLLGLAMGACSKNDPEQAVEHFYAACQEGHFMEAMSYSSIPADYQSESAEEFVSMGVQVEDFEVLSSEILSGDSVAVVQVRLTMSNEYIPTPSESQVAVRVVRQNGDWKVVLE